VKPQIGPNLDPYHRGVTVLDEILASKRDEVTMLHRPQVRDLLRARALEAPPTRDFMAALRPEAGTLGVIAEIKRRSPSKGELAPDLDPALTAKAYAAGGASCLSVLTDQLWFGGSVDDLAAARAACELPVLRKDFTIDEVQVYETRAVGADAILLIVAALPDDAVLRDLHDLALGLGLAVLVETHDDAELERALALGARVVGVNARNLGTFEEDLGVGERLAARVPADVVAIAESAIRSVDDAERMAAAGFDAVLVGEMLVRAPDATTAVRGLAGVSRPGR
jgi:indole-3-glycerol phosphate synthase